MAFWGAVFATIISYAVIMAAMAGGRDLHLVGAVVFLYSLTLYPPVFAALGIARWIAVPGSLRRPEQIVYFGLLFLVLLLLEAIGFWLLMGGGPNSRHLGGFLRLLFQPYNVAAAVIGWGVYAALLYAARSKEDYEPAIAPESPPPPARGVHRVARDWQGRTIAVVRGDGREVEMTEDEYRKKGYEPPFDELPWSEGT